MRELNWLGVVNFIWTLVITLPLAVQRWRELRFQKRRDDAVRDDLVVDSSSGDESTSDEDQTRDVTKYSIGGKGCYGKGRLVLEIIKRYVANNPSTTYANLTAIFPKALRGVKNEKSYWGCVNVKGDAVELFKETGRKRHFLGAGETMRLADGTEIAVSSQWGSGNIHLFIDAAKRLGFAIKPLAQKERIG